MSEIIEKLKEKLGLDEAQLKALLVEMGFKPKAIKVESPEVIARRKALDDFLKAGMDVGYQDTMFKTFGDVITYADHLRAEFKELRPRVITAAKPYEQSDGFKTVIIQLNPENAQKAGHPVAVLEIEGSSNWRSVMLANGYTLGQVGMVSKGHRDHKEHRNGYVGKGNLTKHGLFQQATAEQVEVVEKSTAVNQ